MADIRICRPDEWTVEHGLKDGSHSVSFESGLRRVVQAVQHSHGPRAEISQPPNFRQHPRLFETLDLKIHEIK